MSYCGVWVDGRVGEWVKREESIHHGTGNHVLPFNRASIAVLFVREEGGWVDGEGNGASNELL